VNSRPFHPELEIGALTISGSIRKLPRPPSRGERLSKPSVLIAPYLGDLVANTKSAEKAARQAEKHRARNVALRSRMRSAIRKVTAAVAGGNQDAAKASYQEAVPLIDTLVTKQIIHRNKADRHKSRLAARIRAMR
jgi:small subunit ribosomal protein S20